MAPAGETAMPRALTPEWLHAELRRHERRLVLQLAAIMAASLTLATVLLAFF